MRLRFKKRVFAILIVAVVINRLSVLDSLSKISTDFWAWRMQNSREFSTSVGLYKYNDLLDSYAYEKFDALKKSADLFLERLSWINRDTAAKEKKIEYDVLKNILDTFLAGYKWKDYQPLNPINFLELWFVGLDLFVSSMPFETEGDFVNYVRRVELIPSQLEEMMELCKRAMANGHTSHNASVSRVPGNIASFVTINAKDSELYKPYTQHATEIYGDRKSDIESRLVKALDAANAKFRNVSTFIKNEYMPKARPGFGIGSLPGGLENYEACLYYHTSTNTTAEEVHNIGLREVERITALVRQKMANVGFPESTGIGEMYQNLSKETKFLIPDKAEALAKFNEIIFQRIQPIIPQYFVNVPNLPLEIRPSPSDGVGGEYWTGTADGSRPGIFYVNLHQPDYNPTYKMVALSLHEAIPGHHLAESYGLLADIQPYMKNFEWLSYGAPYFFPFFNSFSEGWALYAEYLGEEMGIYHDDYEMLGRYAEEMLRAVRLVVDTGIHHYNWTRQRAIDYMSNYTAETPDSAGTEIDRYATWPGQATGYKIGELKIKELRQRAASALGNKFDLREFHYTVLRYGALPLDVLENVIDDWIAEQQSAVGTTNSPTAKPQPDRVNAAYRPIMNFSPFFINVIFVLCFVYF